MKKNNLKLKCITKILRFVVILLMVNVQSLYAASSDIGQVQITLHLKNVEIEEVLNIIQEQTGFSFLYNNEVLKNTKRVDVEIENGSVNQVLIHTLANTNIGYKIDGNVIILSPKIASPGKNDLQQDYSRQNNKTISGLVVDEEGDPLPGVNIMIKGTFIGTTTNIEGAFSIELENNNAILIFSFVGYKTIEEAIVENNEFLKIQLQPEIASLNEVIVVAYNEQTKASFTGSAVAIDLETLNEAPRASFQESLQGAVSGVFSQSSSGQPGSMPIIRIRGVGSINASNSPLYVVDGIPLSNYDITSLATSSNSIAGLNTDDIATLTVLKDASATSIYGSRGANGVILITTKHGKSGKIKFDLKVQHGFSEIIFDDKNKPLRTNEISELLVESRVNNGDTQEEAEDYIYSRIDNTINTNWFDEITRRGSYSKYTLSSSGGSDNTTYYSSVSYNKNEGVVIGVDYEKLNGKLNVRNKIGDRFVVDYGVSANSQKLHTTPDAGSAGNPIRAIYRTMPWYSVYNDDGTYNTDFLLTYNPIGLVNENTRESKIYGAVGNIGVKWYLLEGLSFESKGNVEFNLSDEFQYDNPYFGAGRNDGGIGRSYITRILNWNTTNLLKYNLDLNSNHNLNFTLGYEAQKITRNWTYAQARNYSVSNLYTLANASVPYEASTTETGSAIESYLLSISYSFSEKYIFNLTGRRDGSSRFGSSVRYANFGSIGLAWNIHMENFLKPITFINDFKLRTSYGINGNQDGIDDFASKGLYTTGIDYYGNPGFAYYQQSNPNLTWEKNKPFNIALDFRMFKRLSGTVEYYSRVTSDLLMDVPLSATNGITNYLDNRGEMVNSGLEISLSSQNILSENGFNWTTDFNISTNKNEITNLPGEEPIITTTYIRDEGYEYYAFYLVGYAGVNPDNGDALWYTDETETITTNDYSEAERYYQGSSIPKFFGGLTNTLNYKGLTFSFMFYYNYGNEVYDYWGRYIATDGNSSLSDRGNMSRKIYEDRWQEPGDITDVPKVVWGNSQSGSSSQHSTRFLYDGSYIRLRDITLSYNIPSNWMKKVKLSNARIYVRGSNLWTYTWDKDLEFDPEVGLGGLTDLRIPATKQVVFGIDLSF